MIPLNPISVLLLYSWNHLLRNTSLSSLMMLDPRCIRSFTYYVSLLWLQLLTLTYQDFHQIGYFTCIHPYIVSLDISHLGCTFERYEYWLNSLIYFKVAFNQSFLISAGNFVIYAKILGFGMKCDTSESDSTELGNEFFSSFTTDLTNLCKLFPILFDEGSTPFH